MSNYIPFLYLRVRFPIMNNGDFLYTYETRAFPPLNASLEDIEKLDGHDPYFHEQISNILLKEFPSDENNIYATNFDEVEINPFYSPPTFFNTFENLGINDESIKQEWLQNELRIRRNQTNNSKVIWQNW